MHYRITTPTAEWQVSTVFENATILDGAKKWPALCVRAITGKTVVRIVAIEPQLWNGRCPWPACHLVIDDKGSVIARAVHLVDALERIKP